MYIRIKEISGRRYLYLVEGARHGGSVEQKTIAYLGSLSKLARGIPAQTRKKAEARAGRKVDWKRVMENITKIPIRWEELEEIKKTQYSASLKFRIRVNYIPVEQNTSPKEIFQQRSPGELKALARLAAIGFDRMFEQIGERKYRMRTVLK